MEAPIGEYTDKNESKNISSDQILNYFESKGVCSSTLPNNKIPHPSQAGANSPLRGGVGYPTLSYLTLLAIIGEVNLWGPAVPYLSGQLEIGIEF
jgi:hypothetical protein